MLLARVKQYVRFLDSRWFSRVSWVVAVLAPLPLALRLFRVSTAPSVEGVSIEAYGMLAVLHFVLTLRGIKLLDSRIVITFALTSSISATIVVVTLLRGGKFFLV